MQSLHRVDRALRDKTAIGLPDLRPEERVIEPSFRRVDVEIGRHDVVVAGEHDRLAACEQAFGVFRQSVEPAQFILLQIR